MNARARHRFLSFVVLGAITCSVTGQVHESHLKHRLFVYWGYNRAQYTLSNIHFAGPGYDFILHDVVAKDEPKPFSAGVYFDPADMTLPQYNYRIGWFLNERWSFSIGMDHMKYVVVHDQDVTITGSIAADRSSRYAGTEEHTVTLTADFLRYEHSDGLNLLSIDADHYAQLAQSMNGKFILRFIDGVFVGPVIPRTDVTLFGNQLNNKFHLSGYGAGLQAGLLATFKDRWYLRMLGKGGYIELPDVLTTGTDVDRARQRFWFVEEYAVAGVMIGK